MMAVWFLSAMVISVFYCIDNAGKTRDVGSPLELDEKKTREARDSSTRM
jgi:hypothetical protein